MAADYGAAHKKARPFGLLLHRSAISGTKERERAMAPLGANQDAKTTNGSGGSLGETAPMEMHPDGVRPTAGNAYDPGIPLLSRIRRPFWIGSVSHADSCETDCSAAWCRGESARADLLETAFLLARRGKKAVPPVKVVQAVGET
jgi:hypothetical protein